MMVQRRARVGEYHRSTARAQTINRPCGRVLEWQRAITWTWREAAKVRRKPARRGHGEALWWWKWRRTYVALQPRVVSRRAVVV